MNKKSFWRELPKNNILITFVLVLIEFPCVLVDAVIAALIGEMFGSSIRHFYCNIFYAGSKDRIHDEWAENFNIVCHCRRCRRSSVVVCMDVADVTKALLAYSDELRVIFQPSPDI